MKSPDVFTRLDSARKTILLIITVLVATDIAVAFFLYDGNSDESSNARTAVTNVEVMLTTGAAAGLGLFVAVKQGRQGLHGKTYAALAIGLVMWTVGEIWWVYDEVLMQNELPTSSLADIFWLAGYGFFGYHLFKNYLYFAKTVNRTLLLATGVGTTFTVMFVIFAAASVAQIESSEDMMSSIFRVSYAIGDCVVIFPALLMVVTLRKAKLHFSPWFFISVGLLLTALADVIFAFVSLLSLSDSEWTANLLYNAANLTIAGGLYWYYKFIVSFGMKASLPNATASSMDNKDKLGNTDAQA